MALPGLCRFPPLSLRLPNLSQFLLFGLISCSVLAGSCFLPVPLHLNSLLHSS